MTPIRVIQTIADIGLHNGGPTRAVRSLCEAMARAGASVTLLAGDHGHPESALLRPDPALVTTRLVPIHRRFGLPAYQFDLPPADILHDNGIWNPGNFAATTAAARAGLPTVITPHGMLDPWALAHKSPKKRLAWHLYQHRLLAAAAGLHAAAPPECAAIRAKFPRHPIAVIPNGVDCPDVLPPRTPGKTILALSRLHPVKNLPGLIAAFAIVAADPDFAGWRLAIHGPDTDNHRAALAAAIAAAGLQDRIHLGDAVSEAEKPALFAAAELFILPSFSENFGIVAAEALAHGLPVIASTGTPWADLPARSCGWHVDSTPESLAAVMKTAMALTPGERAAMGARGHAYARDAFGWPTIAAQMLDFYRWLLHHGPLPACVNAPP